MKQKIYTRGELKTNLEKLQSEGKKIGYTSGVFDLMHPGHVQYLEDAKAQIDILVVGVNSDLSVKKIKGPLRPIVNQQARAQVVAGLLSVDFVFCFDESNNNENIQQLKPDVYFKAGDYSMDKLSSKPIVESYGGKVVLVPALSGFSSTKIINDIVSSYGSHHATPDPVTYKPAAAIFVDRDGTIVEHIEYLHEPEKVKIIAGALEALKVAQDKGYRIVIVTNQPGIGLGYFTKEEMFATNREIMRAASKIGLMIDKIYYSPYSKSDNTKCRKPNTGMIDIAKTELNLIIADSFCVGDMTSDIQLAINAKCKSVLVNTGSAGKDGLYPDVKPDYTLNSLADLASILP